MFNLNSIKEYIADIHEHETEVISFVERTTEEAGLYATVAFKNLSEGTRHEITVLKSEFAAWFKSKASKIADAATEIAVETATGLLADEAAGGSKSIKDVVIEKAQDYAEKLIDESSVSDPVKVVLKELVEEAPAIIETAVSTAKTSKTSK